MEKKILGNVGLFSRLTFEQITGEEWKTGGDAVEQPVAPVRRQRWILGQLNVGVRVAPQRWNCLEHPHRGGQEHNDQNQHPPETNERLNANGGLMARESHNSSQAGAPAPMEKSLDRREQDLVREQANQNND